ncbi:MAG: hypothetical protein ACJA2X_002906 [Halocynthiibacter sp.]
MHQEVLGDLRILSRLSLATGPGASLIADKEFDMQIFRSLVLFSGLLGLAACSTPSAPSLSLSQFQTAKSDMQRAPTVEATALNDMPSSGSVQYIGKLASSANVNNGMMGDLTMNVNFGSSNVSGNVKNLNYISEGTPSQTFGGTLSLNGQVNGRFVNANASGEISAVASGLTGHSNINLALVGRFRNDNSTADLISGTMTGTGRGDFDFDITQGTFFAAAD